MLPSHLEAVLLDFDHTLAHLGGFVRWEDARRELLPLYRANGVPDAFLRTHEGALSLYGDVAASGLLTEAKLREAQRQASRILETFEAEAIPPTFVLPAAIELVAWLPKLGLRAGIVTSNTIEVVSAILDGDGVTAVFEAIIGRDDVHRLKPSPQGLLRCCERMGVAPERCIYVGDSASDIEAAHSAGMPGIGLREGNSSDSELMEAGAEAVLDGLDGLLGVLKQASTDP